MRPVLAVLALLVLPASLPAATAEKDLTAADRERLAKEKILVGRGSFPSVTSPYKSPDVPVFITSDSVLAAYHALLREGTARLEWARGQALRGALAYAHERLPEAAKRFSLSDEITGPAARRAWTVLAVARLLLGDEPDGVEAALREARGEVRRIESAEGVGAPPAWVGPASPGFAAIDYSRFRPTGILAEVPETARVARAISWLSWLPFRVARDEELVSFLMIAAAAEGAPRHAAAFGGHDAVLGVSEDPVLSTAPDVPARVTTAVLAGLRRKILAGRGEPRVRDMPVLPGASAGIAARLLPLAAPDDSVLLQRVSDRQFAAGVPGHPSALAVAAALGSAEARAALTDGGRAVVAGFEGFAGGGTLHDRYLRCLAILLAPPPEAAPDLFRGEAWRTKSLQTTLAGYTLWRHAWDLSIKDGMRYFGMKHVPPGFVEPVPAFFRTLEGLSKNTGRLMEGTASELPLLGGAIEAAIDEAAARALSRAGLLEGDDEEARKKYWEGLGNEVEREPVLDRLGNSAYYHYLSAPMRKVLGDGRHAPRTEEERAACVAWLRERAVAARKRKDGTGRSAGLDSLAKHFDRLAKLLAKLADLAEKQLAGKPFTKEEREWIDVYGRTLGRIMGEGDNPTDDAPVAVSIFSDPASRTHLVEAVGRPRPLWILYPFEGKEILCRGVVLPWYEMSLPRTPTDGEWKAMLDSKTPPARPAAVRSIEVR